MQIRNKTENLLIRNRKEKLENLKTRKLENKQTQTPSRKNALLTT